MDANEELKLCENSSWGVGLGGQGVVWGWGSGWM